MNTPGQRRMVNCWVSPPFLMGNNGNDSQRSFDDDTPDKRDCRYL